MTLAIGDLLFGQDHPSAEATPSDSVRWGLCFALIVAAHLGIAWLVLYFVRPLEQAPALPPAAIMIELAPVPAAPTPAITELPPGPQQEAAQPAPAPVEQEELPVVPESPAPKVTVPLPPKPKPKPRPQRTVPQAQPEPEPDIKPPATVNTAPPQVEAPPATTATAVAAGAAATPSTNTKPNWQSLLLGRLEQFKRYPSDARFRHQQGVVYLHFTMDRSGKVLSARIERSSGVASLDDEAVALVHRAEPLPPPPAEVAGNTIELVVPVEFFLK